MRRTPRNVAMLAAAALLAAAATAPPFDRLADRSFAWHMLQHLALLYPVAALVLLARPFELVAAIAGKPATASLVRATRPFHALASPPVAIAAFVAVLWFTHFSGLYELALEDARVHAAEHALYLCAGIAFWLPVLAPPPLRPQSYPARLLYLAVALPQGALLGMAIEAARAPLYPHYAAIADSISSALADQRNAAAAMWIAGGTIVFAAFLITLGVWAGRERATLEEA